MAWPIKHGLWKHPLYAVWADMKSRCSCITHPQWERYGGRGIAVCEVWKEFMPFFRWAISSGWRRGLMIDREDNNDGYRAGNCRWVTAKKSSYNRRTTKLTETKVIEIRRLWEAGEMQKNLAVSFGIARNTVSQIVNLKRWN